MEREVFNSSTAPPAAETRFLVLVRSPEGERRTRLLIESLRAFGGRLKDCPVWVFLPDPDRVSDALPGIVGVHAIPLAMEDEFQHYVFAHKVYACAQAEERAVREGVRSLVWLSPDCLVVCPPLLFDLAPAFDAAFRPVHVKNVGLLVDEPLDDYWAAIYGAIGIPDPAYSVESFVEGYELRPYYNSHLFSIDPARGVLRTWWEFFKTLVSTRDFQQGPCRDEAHQVFLHQAVLSAVLAKLLAVERILLLPPEYSYPLHFQGRVPQARRAQRLNDLVCPVYEELQPHPDGLAGIEVDEPLRSWLSERVPLRVE
jgi:hypothetical protein